MSFSFNWAGINVPQASTEGNATVQNRSRTDAGAWGAAARGYERAAADRQYGDLLKNFREGNSAERVNALKEELRTLKARNMEIAAQLGM